MTDRRAEPCLYCEMDFEDWDDGEYRPVETVKVKGDLL